MTDLSGRTILTLVSNYGVEQDELLVPVRELREQGAAIDVAAVEDAPVVTLVGDKDPGETVTPDRTLDGVEAASYDALLVPGGTINADQLRLQDGAVDLARSFADAGKVVAAICHGPWLLVEAGLLDGKTLTSYASVRTDIVNAGGTWEDTEVATCPANGWTLVTSRSPADLKAFVPAIADALTTG
ncbi:Intracellular protease, PfpI family [Nostocoides japonicum T1-X7]|uniref:Intracellular protease, PfpI family n=1 Tax=Nostocoides japonicum T1-X7 TaxID=1194083 RepID=A0A077LWZ7_9MICO|nr:type 1 glutamine amidotransferase domain-containing protein [Tetrasphaera japonica]CCH76465.1 Intracellular protease, PfpI family [Tetrasphaera japonica T1-X7]